jgi:hypothetical protein
MRQIKYGFILLLVLAASFTMAQSSLPAARVTAFLNKYHVMKFSGLPNPHQTKILGQYFSPKLNKQIQQAWKAQQKFIKQHKDEVPPLVEGDLFSSLFEGATSFEIGLVAAETDKTDVVVKFRHAETEQKDKQQTWQVWTDKYKLIRTKLGWFIDDIEYQGNWDFAPKGLLSDALNQASTDSEK